jgi:UDP-GlcNAc3NAcA epimerase
VSQGAGTLRLLTVVGARPQFIKTSVFSRLIRSAPYRQRVTEYLVHTGQHYDESMSEVFFREMEIPEPDVNLGIGSRTHGRMTGEMLAAIEILLMERRPDIVLVYGDTNTTLAGALAAAKLGIPVAHVEAGLRSYNMQMPEEVNRLLTDQISTWLFCPTANAVENLRREGLPNTLRGGEPQRVLDVGDVMLDACLYYRSRAAARKGNERVAARLGLPQRYVLATLHRAENTDNADRLRSIVRALNAAADRPIVFPVHPRTRKALAASGLELGSHVRAIEPVGYLDMLELEEACELVVTDSGGVQKEAFFMGKPCVTMREETEWTETVEAGWNRLVGASEWAIADAISSFAPKGPRPHLYGEGKAGIAILDALCR